MKEKGRQLEAIRQYTATVFQDDATGHDFWHMQRVARMAKSIAKEENANIFITEAAGWLHDIGDHKLFDDPARSLDEMNKFLKSIDLSPEEIKKINIAIRNVSFSKGNIPTTLEGKIVQDADRIDAMGAIGIARAFAYGGTEGQLIFHEKKPKATSIQHFYDKLLKLRGLLNTKSAKRIANERHEFMKIYLKHFFDEW